jgi:hypothetical protein
LNFWAHGRVQIFHSAQRVTAAPLTIRVRTAHPFFICISVHVLSIFNLLRMDVFYFV